MPEESYLLRADYLNKSGFAFHDADLYEEAHPLYERSLAILGKALGPEHPDVATSLNNLSELHRTQGRCEEAKPEFERVLAIREKVLGPEHPKTKLVKKNLEA